MSFGESGEARPANFQGLPRIGGIFKPNGNSCRISQCFQFKCWSSTRTPIETIEAFIAAWDGLDVEDCGFETHHVAANGNVVLTERTDWFVMKGKRRTIRVMGTYELNDEGEIALWRDHFDSAEFVRELGDLAEG